MATVQNIGGSPELILAAVLVTDANQLVMIAEQVTLAPVTIMNDGGYDFAFGVLTGVLPDGDYNVHVGPLGTAADPVCYSGVPGNENIVRVASGLFSLVFTALPVGGPYPLTLVPLDGVSPTRVTNGVVTVVPHDFRSRTLSLRRVFPPFWDTGIRFVERESFPQS